jgi:acyl-CoA synthetase (AMP-forming)/AMP-acid ligase II
VSPVEIEDVLLAHPKKLIIDVTVAGINDGRTSDEKIPHAWVILSNTGKMMGVEAVKRELDTWHKANLSKVKWLRGGIEVVQEVRAYSDHKFT